MARSEVLVGRKQQGEAAVVAGETGDMGQPEGRGQAPQANTTVEHVGRQISAHLILLISLVLNNESKLNLN